MANKQADSKSKNDIHLKILQDLLKLEDNKYCVDCDAKGPRWASTNLGVFLCIRCAGIHRNLGVHISRVKSVTLDSWTAEQIAMMKAVGNSLGREIYEATLTDSYCRPQSTKALETFIRCKYETRRYIAPNFKEIKPDVQVINAQVEQLQSQLKKCQKPQNSNIPLGLIQSPPGNNKPTVGKEPINSTPRSSNIQDTAKKSTMNDLDNIFGDFNPPPSTVAPATKPTTTVPPQAKTSSSDLDGLDFAFNTTPSENMSQHFMSAPSGGKQDSFEKSKESILALFNTPSQSNQFGNNQNYFQHGIGLGKEAAKSPTNPPPSYGSIFSPTTTVNATSPACQQAVNQAFPVSWPTNCFFGSSSPVNPVSPTNQTNDFANFSSPPSQTSQLNSNMGQFNGLNSLSSPNTGSINTHSHDLGQLGSLFSTTANSTYQKTPASPQSNTPIMNNGQNDYLASIQSQLASLSMMKQN